MVPAFDNIEIYNLVCGTFTTQHISPTAHVCTPQCTVTLSLTLIAALLNIKPSDNNGTFGSLYPMLRPEVASKLPPGMYVCMYMLRLFPVNNVLISL